MEIVNVRPISRHVGAIPKSIYLSSRVVVIKEVYFMIPTHIMASIQEIFQEYY